MTFTPWYSSVTGRLGVSGGAATAGDCAKVGMAKRSAQRKTRAETLIRNAHSPNVETRYIKTGPTILLRMSSRWQVRRGCAGRNGTNALELLCDRAREGRILGLASVESRVRQLSKGDQWKK